MQTKIALSILLLVATALTTSAANVWQVGMNDNAWPVGNGGGPNATFVAETGGINPLPGTPNSPEVDRLADNDYYFSGVYSFAIPSVTASYGAYSPFGVVSANEEAAERAFAAGDLDLRYHFNLPATAGPDDLFSVSYDAFNLHIDPVLNPDPRFGIEIYVNGVQVAPENLIRPAQIGTTFTSPSFTLSSVNAQTGPGWDNIVSLRGISYNGAGGGNWMGIDYVQLDVTPVPEPSSIALMTLFGGLGLGAFLLRRRR